jgi:hypothetical protein
MLLTKEEQKQFAVLANALIDIPWVPEEMEQIMFEHAINILERVLQEALPDVFHELMRTAEKGIDPAQVPAFTERVINSAGAKVDLPYLNEEQETQFLRLIINPMVKSMAKGKNLTDLLPQLPTSN